MAFLVCYCFGVILLGHNLVGRNPFIVIIVLKLSYLPILCNGFRGLFELLWQMFECIFCDPFQTLRRNFTELQKRVESLTTPPLESLLGKVRILSARPIAEFSHFEAMELIEAIKDAAQDSKHESFPCNTNNKQGKDKRNCLLNN